MFKVGDRVIYVAGVTQYKGTVEEVRKNVKVNWDDLETHWVHPKRIAIDNNQTH